MTLITGNTFPVKEQLKALGAKWNPAAKGWNVPNNRLPEAGALMGWGELRGCACGSWSKITKSTDCWDCRKVGSFYTEPKARITKRSIGFEGHPGELL